MAADELRFSRWSPVNLGLTFEAAVRLLYARLRLPRLTFVKLPATDTSAKFTDEQLATARFLARAVAAATSRSPIGLTCVHQALALWWMLRARGIPGELRVGVLPQVKPFSAHAWVQCGNTALNETPSVLARYAPFTEAVLPQSRSLHHPS